MLLPWGAPTTATFGTLRGSWGSKLTLAAVLVPEERGDDRLLRAVVLDAGLAQHLRGPAGGHAEQPEQHVLGADEVVPEVERSRRGLFQDLLALAGERDVPGRRPPARGEPGSGRLGERVERGAE